MNGSSIIVVADVLFPGGGNLRALRSLREYTRHFRTYLFLLSRTFKKEDADIIIGLLNAGVKIVGYTDYYAFAI